MAEDDKPYVVGYGRPPQGSRFQPGRSGNPRGRPKGAKNFSTLLQDELDARVVVTENGQRKTISKRQAIAKQLVNKAAAGDPRALPILLNEARLAEGRIGSTGGEAFGPEDEAVLDRITRRLREAPSASSVVPDPQQPDADCVEEGDR